VNMGEGTSFVVADIPGLIEGAAQGVGLGHEFLRHVERCRMLLHVLDASGSEGRNPIEDFERINYELKAYNEELSEREQIVVLNKCDMASEEQLELLREYFKSQKLQCFEIMAAIAEGTTTLIDFVAAELQNLPPIKRYEPEIAPVEDFTAAKKREFTLRVEQDVFIIEGAPWLLKILESINPDDYESLQYFQRVLQSSGIINALIEAGVKDGDTVSVYDIEFDYVS
ncbi:MAG: Obg family GTPase CgtA, partial [Oscillospiraceae bacterium]